LSFRRL